MKTLSDITPQFIRSHYYNGGQAIIETSVFTFDSPKYYICAGIKKAFVVLYSFHNSALGGKCHSKVVWARGERWF